MCVSFLAKCAFDVNQISTFDNATYPLKMDSKWHVIAAYVPKINQSQSRNQVGIDENSFAVNVKRVDNRHTVRI